MTIKITDTDLQDRLEPDIKIAVSDLFTATPPPLPVRRSGSGKFILIGIVSSVFVFFIVAGCVLAVLNRGNVYRHPMPMSDSRNMEVGDVKDSAAIRLPHEPIKEISIEEITELAKKGTVMIIVNTRTGFRIGQSQGTGIAIARKENYVLIMTNQHVIENGRTYTVTLSDGSRYTNNAISLVALPKDRTIDLALLRVEDRAKKIIPSLAIGDYNSIVQGSEVVAFGNPSGLGFTVTRGIVSALRENLFIQTDAAINPGNSGGPLISRTGQLIGINTFIARDTQGIGFAVRADYALKPDIWNTFEDITHLWNELLIPTTNLTQNQLDD